MIMLKTLSREQKKLNGVIAGLTKKLVIAKRNLAKLSSAYPFVCKKCGCAYMLSEVGYKRYESRKEHQACQPMGEYDIYQYVVIEELACCPKCGYNFKVKVWYDDVISQTKTYGRWDDRQDFSPCYTTCIDKRIRKLDKDRIRFMSHNGKRHDRIS